MELYKRMYTLLFNAVTDALSHMEKANYGLAAEELRKAQISAEALYVASAPPDKRKKRERKIFGCGL